MPVHDRKDQVPAVEHRRQRAGPQHLPEVFHRDHRFKQGHQREKHEAQQYAAQQAESPAGEGGLRFFSDVTLEKRTVRNLRAGI